MVLYQGPRTINSSETTFTWTSIYLVHCSGGHRSKELSGYIRATYCCPSAFPFPFSPWSSRPLFAFAHRLFCESKGIKPWPNWTQQMAKSWYEFINYKCTILMQSHALHKTSDTHWGHHPQQVFRTAMGSTMGWSSWTVLHGFGHCSLAISQPLTSLRWGWQAPFPWSLEAFIATKLSFEALMHACDLGYVYRLVPAIGTMSQNLG